MVGLIRAEPLTVVNMTRTEHQTSETYGTFGDPTAQDKPGADDSNGVSLWSRLFFSYVTPMMRLGNERPLAIAELLDVPEKLRVPVAHRTFQQQYEKRGQSVLAAAGFAYGRTFAWCGLASLFSAACSVFAPIVLHHVISAFDDSAGNGLKLTDLGAWLAVFFGSKVLNAFASAHMTFHMEVAAMELAVSLRAMLFAKSMKVLAPGATNSRANIYNVFTSDIMTVLWGAFQFNKLWILPIQIVAVVFMLYQVLEFAAVAGFVVIVASILAGFHIAKWSGRMFQQVMARRDTRMGVVNEVFNAIQIVKLNTWEGKFADKIRNLRQQELATVARYLYIGALNVFVLWTTPLFVSIVSFAVYTLVLGKPLTAATVFTAMALFNTLQDPLSDLPNVIQAVIQSKVALQRISDYLSAEELAASQIDRTDDQQDDIVIDIKSASFGVSADQVLIHGASFAITKGDLVVVHGPVGSGKSSLCAALLGNLTKLSGSARVSGRIAYYSQETWLQHMSIRDNILFGLPFDHTKYQRIVAACGLTHDLAQLPAGDATELGQKGVNLSGGQKARVCLARACYSDADMFILDSPLAAVDAVVQRAIFHDCICSLLHDKTIILVTHSNEIISSPAVSCLVRLDKGNCVVQHCSRALKRQELARNHADRQETLAATTSDARKTDIVITDGRLVDDEARSEGRVSKQVFHAYMSAMGGANAVAFLVLIQTLWQAFQIGSDLWLTYWTSNQQQPNGDVRQDESATNMVVYAVLGLGSAFMVAVRAVSVSALGLRASRKLFDAMTASLLHTPLAFFDANPIGRIVNRYGDDVSTTDVSLSPQFDAVLGAAFFTICQLGTAVLVVRYFGLLVFPLALAYFRIASFYLAPSRDVSRLWKISLSPVLNHLTESVEGAVVLRAFGSDFVARTIRENWRRIEQNNRAWFTDSVVRQWFQLRMQLLGCGVVVVVVSALVYLHDYISPGLVGVAFSYALRVDSRLADLVQSWAYVEILMVSPERILAYASLPSEGNSSSLVVTEPPSTWPRSGLIVFDNVVFTYRPTLAPVLKSVSFAIRSNEKVGVVGRTGAGKSSLVMALFRVNELTSGRIFIDSTNIAVLPLQTLRSRMAIVPQSPVLFQGSLRSYMDPFDEFTDLQVWDALAKVEMKQHVAAMERGLLHELRENGDNLSVGERQQLCMARALLTKSRVVIMDEATASIDAATETKLRIMLQREFVDATVVTIAHRLATVIDSDRILVLQEGQVAEFDTPRRLAQDPRSRFYQLAKDGGCLQQLLS